jgi:hypothetical protein
MFNVVAKAMVVKEHQHIPSPQKNPMTFPSILMRLNKKLERNYTLHPSSQTHNHFIDLTTHFKGDPMSTTIFLLY